MTGWLHIPCQACGRRLPGPCRRLARKLQCSRQKTPGAENRGRNEEALVIGYRPLAENEGGQVPGSPSGPAPAPAAGTRYWQRVLGIGLAGNTVEPLIDGPAAFAAIQRAIESAQTRDHYIYLLGWWCDPWVNLTRPGTCLLDLFARAGERGVQVRVLIWRAGPRLLYPNHVRLHDAAAAALNRLPNCHAQQDDAGATKSQHQKLLVVNGRDGLIALCGGVDVNADRLHSLPPPRTAYRSDRPAGLGWVGGSGGSGSGPSGSGEPLHDVHSRVSGPSALPLMRMFRRRWLARSGDRSIDQTAPLRGQFRTPVPRPTGRQFARVGETFDGVLRPPNRPPFRSRSVAVQDIWLRSILGARTFIYIEEQYLISDCAAEAIRTVLPRLQHVTILIPPSEITDLPGRWRRRRQFIEHITQRNPHAGKLHVYTRALVPAESCRRDSGRHLYVHAKMAVIDDELMLIGSANINNRGWETDSELVVAAFEDTPAGQSSTARKLRMALWSHHLGQPASRLADPVRSRGLWDSAPARHVCRYDPRARSDSDDWKPDRLVDPSDRRPADPCCTLLQFCPRGGRQLITA
jgi:phosphatidylserine/phosphatidylglycerophosphate/cardiolipin synthase-like enzyme